MNIVSLGFTKEDYEREAREGYIKIHRHPVYENLILLNYTEHATFERRWNEVTIASRGLIIEESTGKIVALPFPKFFNFGENGNIDVPNGKPEVTVKQDGSLGIMYRYDNKVLWATRGSFQSEQALKAQEIWDKKYSHLNDLFLKSMSYLTLLVEIIYPENRIVTNYGDYEDLMIIGARNIYTKEDYVYQKLSFLSAITNMPLTPLIDISLKEALNKKKHLDANNEGWVFNWNGYRLKIKGDKYLDVHRLMHGISDKRKFELAIKGELSQLIMEIPEEFRTEIEEFGVMVEATRSILGFAINHYFDSLCEAYGTKNRKAFANAVNEEINQPFRHFMFLLLDRKPIEPALNEYLIKNYKEYLPMLK